MGFKKCVVKGCRRNNSIFPETSFFSFPTVKENEKELLTKRRNVWIQRANTTEEKLMIQKAYSYICGIHFILGKLICVC